MIRAAAPDDVEELHALVCELAEYEKLRHTVVSTPEDMHSALFGKRPLLEALVADSQSANQLAGMALFFPTFSSFAGRPGLWLEDVYVRPDYRGRGLGKALLERFLMLARERGCARAEWSVLHWNEPAIRFYQNLGAELLSDWRIARVDL